MKNKIVVEEIMKKLSLEEQLKFHEGKVYVYKDFDDEEYKYLWYFYNAHIEEGNSQWIGFDTIDLSHRTGERFMYRAYFIDYGSPMDAPLIEVPLLEFGKIKDTYFNQILPLSNEIKGLINFFKEIQENFHFNKNLVYRPSSKEFFRDHNALTLNGKSPEIKEYFNRWFFDIKYGDFFKPIGLTKYNQIIIHALIPQYESDGGPNGFEYIVPMEIWEIMEGVILLTNENSERVEKVANKFLEIVKPFFE